MVDLETYRGLKQNEDIQVLIEEWQELVDYNDAYENHLLMDGCYKKYTMNKQYIKILDSILNEREIIKYCSYLDITSVCIKNGKTIKHNKDVFKEVFLTLSQPHKLIYDVDHEVIVRFKGRRNIHLINDELGFKIEKIINDV